MIGYHGTSTANATKIRAGNIDVTKGGGELGQGFYTGERLWLAKQWATGRYDSRQNNVVQFDVSDADVQALNIQIYDGRSATLIRGNIRRSGQTRTYNFGYDMIWSPIVGKETITCDQHKWESLRAETLLNSASVTRTLL